MIVLKVTEGELDYIMRCLSQRPYAEVHQLIPALVAQANAPTAPAPDAAAAQ